MSAFKNEITSCWMFLLCRHVPQILWSGCRLLWGMEGSGLSTENCPLCLYEGIQAVEKETQSRNTTKETWLHGNLTSTQKKYWWMKGRNEGNHDAYESVRDNWLIRGSGRNDRGFNWLTDFQLISLLLIITLELLSRILSCSPGSGVGWGSPTSTCHDPCPPRVVFIRHFLTKTDITLHE